ncbi:hypothetical protein M0802_015797 [Mischocyttarus mexicanus]|nr:hypothetical protein M0802_015797 [Mischocyttarus mexicanus]
MSEDNSELETIRILFFYDILSSKMRLFNPEKIKFPTWLNKFEYVAKLIEVNDNYMKRLFMKMVPGYVHERFKLNEPFVKLKELSYEEITKKYHYVFSGPHYKCNLHKRQFLCRSQYKTEAISQYADNLCEIYNKCFYDDRKGERLCEQFIYGVRDGKLRRYLRDYPYESFFELVANACKFENQKTETINLSKSLD